MSAATRGAGDSIEAMVASFLELHAYRKTRRSTAEAAERIVNRLVLPAWRGRSIHSIKRRDVIAWIEHIATDRPYLANRTLAVLSKFYNWLCARDEIAVSPVAGVERPGEEVVRSRTLTDAELRSLWLACEGDGPFGSALRMLALTGSRRNEVSRMRWSEIDDEKRLWTLPAARSKNRRAHKVSLSAQAWALLQSMPRIVDNDHVFAGRAGRGAIDGGWARAKTRLS